MDAFVGIDLAFAKRKRLPICVCSWIDSKLVPFNLGKNRLGRTPRGWGNRASIDPACVSSFARKVRDYLASVCTERGLTIRVIAIDAPMSPRAETESGRRCEEVLNRKGISCFTTPSKSEFAAICAKMEKHIELGGEDSRLPSANKLWMMVGFQLFKELKEHWDCIEVYPQATVRVLGAGNVHKSDRSGLCKQFETIAMHTGWPSNVTAESLCELSRIVGSPAHDAVDAYSAAWIAALDPPH